MFVYECELVCPRVLRFPWPRYLLLAFTLAPLTLVTCTLGRAQMGHVHHGSRPPWVNYIGSNSPCVPRALRLRRVHPSARAPTARPNPL